MISWKGNFETFRKRRTFEFFPKFKNSLFKKLISVIDNLIEVSDMPYFFRNMGIYPDASYEPPTTQSTTTG